MNHYECVCVFLGMFVEPLNSIEYQKDPQQNNANTMEMSDTVRQRRRGRARERMGKKRELCMLLLSCDILIYVSSGWIRYACVWRMFDIRYLCNYMLQQTINDENVRKRAREPERERKSCTLRNDHTTQMVPPECVGCISKVFSHRSTEAKMRRCCSSSRSLLLLLLYTVARQPTPINLH